MLHRNAATVPLEFEEYAQSQSNLRRLKENLPEDLLASLAREVIRRLASHQSKVEHVPHEPTFEELQEFCTALISEEDASAAEIIVGVRADGVPPEEIYLKYLAAAAQTLGRWWDEDRASFVEVTVGSGRLFAIMRGMRHLFVPPSEAQGRSAIFASVPGEDHTLGVRMAADLFRKEGWNIALKVGLDHDELVAEIEHTPTRIIGLSFSGRHSVDALSRLVVALNISCPHAPLLVSGPNAEEIRPLLTLMGVDGIASDFDSAKAQMSALWEQKQARDA